MFSKNQRDILQVMGLVVYVPSQKATTAVAGDSESIWETPLGRNIRCHLNGIAPERLALTSAPNDAASKRNLWRRIRALLQAP